jgi:hypothetical protein
MVFVQRRKMSGMKLFSTHPDIRKVQLELMLKHFPNLVEKYSVKKKVDRSTSPMSKEWTGKRNNNNNRNASATTTITTIYYC